MIGNKKFQQSELVAGPGVHVFENRQTQTMWLNNENVELETVKTHVSIDPAYIEQHVQSSFRSTLENYLREILQDIIRDHVALDYIVWDDKGTLTTRVLVDGKCVLEKSVEIPLMNVAKEYQSVRYETDKSA